MLPLKQTQNLLSFHRCDTASVDCNFDRFICQCVGTSLQRTSLSPAPQVSLKEHLLRPLIVTTPCYNHANKANVTDKTEKE